MIDGGLRRGLAVSLSCVLALTGCGGSGSGSGGAGVGAAGSPEATRAQLRDYERAADDLHSSMNAVVQGLGDFETALQVQDDTALDAALAAQPARLAAVEDALERLRAAEEGLDNAAFGDEPGVVRSALGFLPVLAAIAGIAGFVEFLREQNTAADAARARRDQAQDGIDANAPGAVEAYQAAQGELNTIGENVIERTTTEIVTELAGMPFEALDTAQIFVTDDDEETAQPGLTVISSTSECGQELPAPGCRIGITQTDASGKATVPSGTIAISVSGNGVSRIEIDDVEVQPDEVIELIVDLVDIDDAGRVPGGGPAAGQGGNGTGTAGGDGGSGSGAAGEDGGAGSGASGAGGTTAPGACSHPDAVGTRVPVSVDLESQADVDALAGCTSVGGLEVGFGTTGITSLAGLESLTEIVMVDDPILEDIDVFSGGLSISDSPELTDISALRNLTRVEGNISIDTSGIREVDLRSLQRVGDPRFALSGGVALGGDLIGSIDLSSLETVMGNIHLTADNVDSLVLPKLRTIEAEGDGFAGGLLIFEADRLAILELPELTSIADELAIHWSDAITAIQAPKLTSVGGRIAIENNTKLVTIGLDTVTSPIGGLVVFQNAALTSIGLNGVPSVVKDPQDIGGYVSIEHNPVLTTLGLTSLQSIVGTLDLCCNDMLASEDTTAFRDRVAVSGI
jgi:hypothetical protein